MKKFISIFLIISIITVFTGLSVFADTYNIAAEEDAMGLTVMQIYVTKSDSTLYYNISTEASHTSSQIGFRNAYLLCYVNGALDNMIPITGATSYNTDYNYASRSNTMSSSVKYKIMVEHYCIINGTTYYQSQTTSEYSL